METSESAQARGQGRRSSLSSRKICGQGTRKAGRTALSESRGQHARGVRAKNACEENRSETACGPQARGDQIGSEENSRTFTLTPPEGSHTSTKLRAGVV